MFVYWQDWIAIGIVAAACSYLARVAWRSFQGTKASTCGGCSSCSSAEGASAANRTLIPVETLLTPARFSAASSCAASRATLPTRDRGESPPIAAQRN